MTCVLCQEYTPPLRVCKGTRREARQERSYAIPGTGAFGFGGGGGSEASMK